MGPCPCMVNVLKTIIFVGWMLDRSDVLPTIWRESAESFVCQTCYYVRKIFRLSGVMPRQESTFRLSGVGQEWIFRLSGVGKDLWSVWRQSRHQLQNSTDGRPMDATVDPMMDDHDGDGLAGAHVVLLAKHLLPAYYPNILPIRPCHQQRNVALRQPRPLPKVILTLAPMILPTWP